jgi:hypothetical protein
VANHWDSVNCIVPISGVDETDWLLRAFVDGELSLDDWLLLPLEDRQGWDNDALYFNCAAQDASKQWSAEKGVWVESDEASVDTIVLILRAFQLRFGKAEPFVLTWASHCNSPREYSTSGGAAAIVGGVAWWFTPQDAAIEKLKQLSGDEQCDNDDLPVNKAKRVTG